MGKLSACRVTVIVAYLVGILVIPVGAQTTRLHAQRRAPSVPTLNPKKTVAIVPEMYRPTDLAWDVKEKHFWITDAKDEQGRVTKVRLDGKKIGDSFYIPTTKPGLIALETDLADDVRRLWIVEPRETVSEEPPDYDSEDDATDARPFAFERLQILQKSKQPSVTGIAVRGRGETRTVWSCRGGGLCASIEVRDSEKELLWSFFPRCEPIDLTFDPDGRRLWIVADNGEGHGAVLLERILPDTRDDQGLRMAASRTQRFLALPEYVKPVAIASTGSSVWVMDRVGQPAGSKHPPRARLYEFRVGDLAAEEDEER